MNRITSYVCSAVYYDRALRNHIIYLLENDHNVIANPHGLQLEEVLAHSYRARNIDRRRQYLLFLPAIILLVSNSATSSWLIALVFATVVLIFYRLRLEIVILRNEFAYAATPSQLPVPNYVNTLINKRQSQICGNVTYYSGYSPFVGSGIVLSGWSFVVDVDKAQQGKTNTIPFQVDEIYNEIAREVNQLNISNLTVSDKLIINGRAIRQNQNLLPNPLGTPVTHITNNEVKAFMNIYNKNARYYQHIQINDWDNELIFSVFLKFYKTGKRLFVECSYSLLTPIKEEYKKINSISPNLSLRQYVGVVVQSLFLSFFATFQSIGFVLGDIASWIEKLIFGRSGNARRIYNQVKRSPDFDYGASVSIRELVASSVYPQYFHVLDKDMHLKTIEKTILASIIGFLETKDIDVSELKQRETQILNEGIIITGGNLTADNINIGKKTTINRITTAIKSNVKTSFSD